MQKRFFSKTALQSSDFEKSDEILRLKDVFLIQLSVLFFGVFLPFDEILITRSIKCEKGCETLWFTSTTQWNETFTFSWTHYLPFWVSMLPPYRYGAVFGSASVCFLFLMNCLFCHEPPIKQNKNRKHALVILWALKLKSFFLTNNIAGFMTCSPHAIKHIIQMKTTDRWS